MLSLMGLEFFLSHFHCCSKEIREVHKHDSAKSLPFATLFPANLAKHKLWQGGLEGHSSELLSY